VQLPDGTIHRCRLHTRLGGRILFVRHQISSGDSLFFSSVAFGSSCRFIAMDRVLSLLAIFDSGAAAAVVFWIDCIATSGLHRVQLLD
jgi:hypothetical protein